MNLKKNSTDLTLKLKHETLISRIPTNWRILLQATQTTTYLELKGIGMKKSSLKKSSLTTTILISLTSKVKPVLITTICFDFLKNDNSHFCQVVVFFYIEFAYWTLASSLKPFVYTFLMEEMHARHSSYFVLVLIVGQAHKTSCFLQLDDFLIIYSADG